MTAQESIPLNGRLPWFAPDDLRPDQRDLYDLIISGPRASATAVSPLLNEHGRLEGPFNFMLLSPALGTALQSVGDAIRYRSELTDRERELAILIVAANARNDFEWIAHVQIARAKGLSEADLHAIAERLAPEEISATERVVFDTVTRLVLARDLDATEWDRLVGAVGLVKAVELVILIGYYQTLALALGVFRVVVPGGGTGPWVGG
ncbi:MAG TPA: carboxymuconolactone decarboxylase family protein [Micromonosporaceae bacterium]|jgi:alkylhydroperoxidase family enzyme